MIWGRPSTTNAPSTNRLRALGTGFGGDQLRAQAAWHFFASPRTVVVHPNEPGPGPKRKRLTCTHIVFYIQSTSVLGFMGPEDSLRSRPVIRQARPGTQADHFRAELQSKEAHAGALGG
ncbi:hypothetical protein SBA2_240045 [Acidobacteriia bacterium SbA2]|nr:hypothetical protein SBA2_240045 [Acidobacteriia bacterium SbA2]